MASKAKKTKVRRKLRQQNAGKKRKNQIKRDGTTAKKLPLNL